MYPEHPILQCDLRDVFPTSSDHLVRVPSPLQPGAESLRVGVQVRDGWYDAPVPAEGGTAVLEIYGLASVRISWGPGHPGEVIPCQIDELQEYFVIRGPVTGEEDLQDAPLRQEWVHGCGGKGSIADDAFYMMVHAPSPCEIHVVQRHSSGQLAGPAVRIEPPGPGEEVVVALERP